ncbi:DUF2141 domain-containing protein [Sphingomonas sp. KR1UV-12]|uniref:DUF2141 domain-containing protein n=1 Tax=Sphingomonas aurea TaxID=3063994 RepID=A0ABT9EKP3_9SPHN|nr:DUF2141 domain-containing protein [Sphingomonas sp. KR1UV-12]MDP1027542.1 DUF2141 domain-containing protein [Sphingomonas sp. KR1UV-12]
MIRNVFFVLGAFAAAAPLPALAQECGGVAGNGAVKLTVQATDLRNGKGEVAFTVYPDDKPRFLAKGRKLYRTRVPARLPVTSSCFWLKPGHYAIAQYHDENADHKFNRTLWMPKEGFGFSNDAPTSVGLPSFESVRFPVPAAGATMRMKMRYQ